MSGDQPRLLWTTCPLCSGALVIPRALAEGAVLFCPRCDCLLEVVSVDPPEVDFPLQLPVGGEEPKLSRRPGRSGRK